MSIPQSLSTLLQQRTTLQVECVDRMYLNVYQPRLQFVSGVAHFFRKHRKNMFASSVLMEEITSAFIKETERFVKAKDIPLISFRKGQRKDDLAKEYLSKFESKEGVLFVGKAQEKIRTFRTEKRTNPETNQTFPWIVEATAMVNQYYFYCVDEEFGPFFLKYSSYFPYNARLCINGHEFLKCQLDKEGIACEALDNGIRSCADTRRMQEIADGFSAEKIADLLHKWQSLLPYPFAKEDTDAGYQYAISILQAEFSLTQVLDSEQTGRLFFEEVIRENLDLGRPDNVQLIFDKRITKATPSVFRTRVVTEGVTPSLHVNYKHSRIKQYHKEGIALRTETTINNTRDFGIGKNLLNLAALRKVGFAANRRLLEIEQISHNAFLGEETFQQAQRPAVLGSQRTSALRFGDASVQAVMQAIVMFTFQPVGFASRDLKPRLAELLGVDAKSLSQGQMTYQLRRLRLHGLIARIPKSHRYQLTEKGLRLSQFYTRAHIRLFRPGLSHVFSPRDAANPVEEGCFVRLQQAMDECCKAVYLAA